VCALNENGDTTQRVIRNVEHSWVSELKGVPQGLREPERSVVFDSRFTYGVGQRPRTLEDMGIDINLYKGAVYGCSPEELKRHIGGYWALPPEDRGRLTRPMTMHVTVTVVLGGVCWRLKCLVDGRAARNVLSTSVYKHCSRGASSTIAQ
jgi:hypothetical protein